MNPYILPGAALLGLVSGGANAAPVSIGTFSPLASAACPAPSGSIWPSDPPFRDGDVGGIYNDVNDTTCGPISFTAPFAGNLTMTVGPSVEFAGGDVYQAFVDGNSLGVTPPVPVFGTQFSTGTFVTAVSAGLHTFDINDQILSYLGFQDPYGPPETTVPGSFSPSSVTITLTEELPSAVPEPRSLALLASSLFGLGFLWLRRRKAFPAL